MVAKSLGLVFGPVCSGRLGLSLGLDLLGAKICSFDCLYCEVGPTRCFTLERRPYVSAGQVLSELEDFLRQDHPGFEVITLGGMGEPTLNSDLAGIIKGARELAPGVPVAVLTNSSLMSDKAVRQELGLADMVLPSMDSLEPSEYLRLNRPVSGLRLADIRQGLLDFRKDFAGLLRLEVLICAGINDTRGNLDKLKEFCAQLQPDRVDVTSLSRPGAYSLAKPASPGVLELFRQELVPLALGRETANQGGKTPGTLDNADNSKLHSLEDLLLKSLRRRPQTAEQLSLALGVDLPLVLAALDGLLAARRVLARQQGEGIFYFTGS